MRSNHFDKYKMSWQDRHMTPINIFVLVAGTNEPSNSNMLADAFIQGMQQHKEVTVHKRRLKDMKIDHFSLDFYDPQCSQEEDFCEFQTLMEECDAFVIATPIWNFGIPGHLKNLIDRMGSFALDETRRKGILNNRPFYIIYTGGAPMGAWLGMMQFTTSSVHEALEYFGATYVGRHFEERCVQGQGKFGLVVDSRPKSLEEMRKKGFEFIMDAIKVKETGKAPFRQRTKKKLMRFGEKLLAKLP